ncbi:alpha/beta fold hydrolase [Nocardioides coralli]|uniref:alpha/beta fold hydrolase n=1 Tax=Nocardioides coralli TaxID=2872154 RepID=UPI001CA3EFEF|nr:alpha/beta hydrolase [Nocardioides coralli]QZY28514.1 alpha/beta fold hydrolase [Nocardioides coralli]
MSAAPSSDRDVSVSEELFAPVNAEVELCYQTFGDPSGEPVLLVMGLGGPMTWWDPEFCAMLARRGRYVIRFDNRDVGRSSRGTGRVTRPALIRAFTGRSVRPPYTLSDLGADAFGLLDHLGLASAHVVGISMGGMIAQVMAIDAPQRVRSLTSIMSTTGKRTVGWQHPRLLPLMLGSRGTDRETYALQSAKAWQVIGSPAFPQAMDDTLTRARDTFDRGVSASGVLRQMLAILAEPDRGPRLRGLRIPALVVHGDADRMVHVSGGRATARSIPDAELLVIEGMGHDLPRELYDTVVEAIGRTIERA